MALYASDGSFNITVVDGTSRTGRYAADGSLNVVQADGVAPCGINHPCGAYWVTVQPASRTGLHAPDGSLYIKVSPYTYSGGYRVTVVSGVLV